LKIKINENTQENDIEKVLHVMFQCLKFKFSLIIYIFITRIASFIFLSRNLSLLFFSNFSFFRFSRLIVFWKEVTKIDLNMQINALFVCMYVCVCVGMCFNQKRERERETKGCAKYPKNNSFNI